MAYVHIKRAAHLTLCTGQVLYEVSDQQEIRVCIFFDRLAELFSEGSLCVTFVLFLRGQRRRDWTQMTSLCADVIQSQLETQPSLPCLTVTEMAEK
ncbi:hypothetical protein T265_02309 [Opisthorchis viverrini]|uniref:Uncharacterized protein n=1 Tax=Opisthorchis viverrini TaxID=6198 RepID=A0A075AIC4_OPIVI|nr:hypothetical protein T265_02309 [Opisthorchis viverrini]KER31389.1 hypothetical protein T265_02309 [Opisthorchis viverrini]